MADQSEVPDWLQSLPDQIAWSISNTLHALAAALRDDVDEESRDTVARTAQVLRGHIHDALTQTTKTAALASKVASAATETNVFSQPESVRNEEAVHVDAVHEAYLRLTPLLSDSCTGGQTIELRPVSADCGTPLRTPSQRHGANWRLPTRPNQ